MLDLVVFCASHMSNPQRSLLLKAQVQSMLEQTYPVPIYVSLTGKCPVMFYDPDQVEIYHHGADKRFSQFQHYYFLCKKLLSQTSKGGKKIDREKTFVLFCDDDDYSHPERAAFYASAQDVGQNSLLARDALYLLQDDEVVDGLEYFMYAVRLSVLDDFCTLLLEHKALHLAVCDLLLNSVLYHSKRLNRSLSSVNATLEESAEKVEWLYIYNNDKNKDREKEIQTYMELLKNDALLTALETRFEIKEWKRGETSVYGEEVKFESSL